jgi:hypothetical protein
MTGSYEEFYELLQPKVKELKDLSGAAVRAQKAVQKHLDSGNVAELKKTASAFLLAAAALEAGIAELEQAVGGFDTRAYVLSGAFARQLVEACEAKGINVRGELGVYEMFPYKVRVLGDEEHAEEVYIDRKKVPSFRPSYIADTIRQGQEKLYKANFNELTFMNELAEAYDTTCFKNGSRVGSAVALTKIYKALTPMARARKEYDMQAFSFDLARIYEAGPDAWVTKNGRIFTFGTSRDGKTGIRVLSRTGVESYITTLSSLTTEE